MLRPIEGKDHAKLKELNADQLGYDFPVELVREQLGKLMADDHHFFLVYEDDATHETAGYVHAEVYETTYSLPLFNVLALVVGGEFQRKGIGKQLMTGLEEEAKRRNLKGIRLNSGESRKEAHQFYESIGYVCDKCQKRFLKTF